MITRPAMAACALLSCSWAYAQSTPGPDAMASFRRDAVKAVMSRIEKKHFGYRPMDDGFSKAVWMRYLNVLDPNRYIFLQEDVDRLMAQQTQIDDQLVAGETSFYDSVAAIFNVRIKEARELCTRALAQPVDFSKEDTVRISRKDMPFPANAREREALWRKLAAYHVLRNYVELKTAAGDTLLRDAKADPAVVARAKEKVTAWYNSQFRTMDKAASSNEYFNQYLAAAMLEIDPHTLFMGPKDKRLEQALTNRYFGIGIELSVQDADFFVGKVLPGGPAWKTRQVNENDKIISVSDKDGKMVPASGLSPMELTAIIRGEKGSSITLALQPSGQPEKKVTITRDAVTETAGKARGAVVSYKGQPYGYIHLPLFYMAAEGMVNGGCAADVAAEMAKLRDYDVKGLILDLRGNGGGSLDEIVKMSALFLPDGPVTWLRTRTGLNRYQMPEKPAAYNGPLVVMVDEGSASASEMLAAVIQDRKRGIIVGPSSTFGKGTAQAPANVGKLGDPAKGEQSVTYGSMRITEQKFYRITGESTQLKGVRPDIIFQDRIRTDVVKEMDYPSSLPCDTLNLPPVPAAVPAFDFAKVVDNARARISANPVFNQMGALAGKAAAHASAPVPLNLRSYIRYNRTYRELEKERLGLQSLDSTRLLEVKLAENRNIRPELRADDPESRIIREWLAARAKDIYIAETLQVLEDIATHATPVAPANGR